MTGHYRTAHSCKDSSENTSHNRAIPDASSDASQQITSNVPYFLAVLAGCTFGMASALTNFTYALGKSPELGQQVLWCSVAVAAAVTVTLAPAAIVAACKRRAIVASALASLALVLCGSYSLTGALGSAVGVRLTAAATETATDGKRTRAREAYDNAARELATLKPARSPAELDPLIATLKAKPGANGCAKIDGKVSRETCAEVSSLEAERARAERRDELTATMQDASKTLAAVAPGKPANADAVALATYLVMAGVKVEADELNRWLALLAVALVEFGGGLSFAVASALRSEPVYTAQADQIDGPRSTSGGTAEQMEHGTSTGTNQELDFLAIAEGATGGTKPPQKLTIADELPCRMLALVEQHGTELLGSNRTFGKALGISHTQAGRVLDQLEATGAITLTKGKSGTVVRLARAA